MRLLLHVLLWLVVTVHIAISLTGAFAALLMILYSPWYVSMLVTILLVNLVFSPSVTCPITMIENRLRIALGYKPVDRFLEKYLFIPIRKIRG